MPLHAGREFLSIPGPTVIPDWVRHLGHWVGQETIGQSLLGDWLTWHQHSQAGFLNMRTPTTPENPVQASQSHPLNWERDVGGGRYVYERTIRSGSVLHGPEHARRRPLTPHRTRGHKYRQ